MATSPVMEWRSAITPYGTLASQAFTGSGYSGAIPVGTTSPATTVRLYNNFLVAAGVADALNCVLAAYDDVVHQGSAVNGPTTGLYTQLQVLDYNGVTTNADSTYYAIGGQTKHAVPTNSGTIGGTGANYIEVSIRIAVPANATQGSASLGLWVEYSSTS